MKTFYLIMYIRTRIKYSRIKYFIEHHIQFSTFFDEFYLQNFDSYSEFRPLSCS